MTQSRASAPNIMIKIKQTKYNLEKKERRKQKQKQKHQQKRINEKMHAKLKGNCINAIEQDDKQQLLM